MAVVSTSPWRAASAVVAAELKARRRFECGFHGLYDVMLEQAAVYGEGGAPAVHLCVANGSTSTPRLPPFDAPPPARAVSDARWSRMQACRDTLKTGPLDAEMQFQSWQFLVDRYEEHQMYKLGLAPHLGVLRDDHDCEYKALRNEFADLVVDAWRVAHPNPVG